MNAPSEWSSLLVDLTAEKRAVTGDREFPMPLTYAGSAAEGLPLVEQGDIVAMLIMADDFSNDLEKVLRAFQVNSGYFPGAIQVISDDPSPNLLAGVFEFGVDQFIGIQNWQEEAVQMLARVASILNDESTLEHKSFHLTKAIRRSEQSRIQELEKSLGEQAEYDFVASYARGKALEATGNYPEAIHSYEKAERLNTMFRPAATDLGEALLVTGRVDDAIRVFERLEKGNDRNINRKVFLASAYIEKGDYTKADALIAEANGIDPESRRVLEAKVQACLVKGELAEAHKLMDGVQEAGPFLASRLNDVGIKLSKAGKGKEALDLYEKAHKVVRQELRYKISLNAALASHRMREFHKALEYIQQCKREYGSGFEKADKIEKAIRELLNK